jgi:two-component system cell cycle sensor histidine kinase/response regulator CckA
MYVIHDLRLVLMSILACIEEIRQLSTDRSLPEELRQANHLVETGLALVNEVLVHRVRQPIAPSIEVNQILEELKTVLMTITGRDIDVTLRLADGDTRVYAQRADLERILLNLALNAAAAMPRGGSLTIESELVDDAEVTDAPLGHVLLTIRDDGCGMSDAQMVRALDPVATPRPNGSGVGLASVALVLERLGGKLAIASELGSGTKVSILIPLAGAGQQIH